MSLLLQGQLVKSDICPKKSLAIEYILQRGERGSMEEQTRLLGDLGRTGNPFPIPRCLVTEGALPAQL